MTEATTKQARATAQEAAKAGRELVAEAQRAGRLPAQPPPELTGLAARMVREARRRRPTR